MNRKLKAGGEMKIERRGFTLTTLQQFAEDFGLTLRITRYPGRNPPITASFPALEVSNGSMLASVYGDGETEHEAIRDYARQITGKWTVRDAHKPSRVEIQVPELSEYSPEEGEL